MLREWRQIAALLAVLATTAVVAFAQATKKEPGKWVAREFAQVNVFCMQSWTCETGKNLLISADMKVVTVKAQPTKGVCNAAGGPTDSCNLCAANPPTTPCEYWLEKK